ncbi:MAG: ATP-binding protein [Treponema sp.]|jgi:hypothetical protein|nr:ATP-binding protein [Treponema sp.]
MFLSKYVIIESLSRLKSVHPFFGITYLVCKENKLPVGETIELPLDTLTKNFMDKVHKLHPTSQNYYQPYKSNPVNRQWVDEYYPSTGLRTTNTQAFLSAFVHDTKRMWGWANNYVDYLAGKLKGHLLPIFDIAVWFFKYYNFSGGISSEDIIEKFVSHFYITNDEREKLFYQENKKLYPDIELQHKKIEWDDFSLILPAPPDDPPGRGATLSYLAIKNVGPSSKLIMEPSSRLNLITGDNGLGKTFIMECSWWALTGTWPEMPVYPKNAINKKGASITYKLAGINGAPVAKTISYNLNTGNWPRDINEKTTPGLIIYARVDGSYAIWDPILQNKKNPSRNKNVFSTSEVWDGVAGSIEGLMRDWVKWQNTPSKYPFDILKSVLEKVSPPDLGTLSPGEPIRILNDTREIPTIKHFYGETPIIHASAGIKRIITLSYLIVWAWNEHKIRASLNNMVPENRLVIIIDELEEHLHPKWQRVILPALVDIYKSLSNELKIQYLISTHSPLILASAETLFDNQIDSLFNFKVDNKSGSAQLIKMDFIKYGQINSWLTSPVFNLGQARSQESENIINQAKNLQLEDTPNKEQIQNVHQKLVNELAEDDPFWPRWIYFAENNGVKI